MYLDIFTKIILYAHIMSLNLNFRSLNDKKYQKREAYTKYVINLVRKK